ncbi:hypothetical protein FACS18949_10750 [Clostridia bacterium]|nr:hypothetical protein FACS18949_10750 [Clostridia bacterium]
MADNAHAGHRERLKRLFLDSSFDEWPQEKVLEFVLFFGNARADVSPLAKQLIDRFGSIWNVLNAPVDRLMEVKGVGEHNAVLLRTFGDLRRYAYAARKNEKLLDTLSSRIEALRPHFEGLKHESMFILCLDSQKRSLGVREIAKGTTRQVRVSLKVITRHAVAVAADSVILAHNHLTGSPAPSAADHATTSSVRAALAQLDMELLDHIIFADGHALSMAGSYPSLDL